MTTTVTVHVGGRYVATIKKDDAEPVDVHGDYDGSPNPGGNYYVTVPHPATAKFEIAEKYLGEAKVG